VIESTVIAAASIATVLFLTWLIRWDLRRTYAEIDHLRCRRPVDPVDFGGEIRAYRTAKDQREAAEERVGS
jgi:hypothetical protein